ncbi:hypothetical protein ACWV95_36425 [Streptomyces albus]
MDVTLSQARECWSEVVERLQHGEEIVLENTRNRQAAVMRRLEGTRRRGRCGPAARRGRSSARWSRRLRREPRC